MLSDPETEEAPPVPSVWRLGWLLFMQPIELYQMYKDWGLQDDDASLNSRLRLLRERMRHPVNRVLIRRYALWLLIIMPLTAILIAGVLTLSGFPIRALSAGSGVALGVAVSVGASVLIGAPMGLAFGMVFGVAFSVTFGISGVAVGVALGVGLGAGVGVGFSVGLGFSGGEAFGKSGGAGVLVASLAYLGTGVILAMLVGLSLGTAWRTAFIVTYLLVYVVAFIRLPLWLVETFFTQWLASRMRRRPEIAGRLASWLPFRRHDLICLPLPGLY